MRRARIGAGGRLACALLLVGLTGAARPSSQEAAPAERQIAVSAHRYGFEPARIEVTQGDLVRIVFTTKDIPHSFTIDAYRLAKRVSPGHAVTFEFRADQAGTFPYYCNLVIDEGCRNMRGELVVKPKR